MNHHKKVHKQMPQKPMATSDSTTTHCRAHIFPWKIFCQIPQASSQNSAAHCAKIIQILQLTEAFCLCINYGLFC